MITLITLFLPAFIVLEMLWDFGEPYECRCVVDGKLLVVAIVLAKSGKPITRRLDSLEE